MTEYNFLPLQPGEVNLFEQSLLRLASSIFSFYSIITKYDMCLIKADSVSTNFGRSISRFHPCQKTCGDFAFPKIPLSILVLFHVMLPKIYRFTFIFTPSFSNIPTSKSIILLANSPSCYVLIKFKNSFLLADTPH